MRHGAHYAHVHDTFLQQLHAAAAWQRQVGQDQVDLAFSDRLKRGAHVAGCAEVVAPLREQVVDAGEDDAVLPSRLVGRASVMAFQVAGPLLQRSKTHAAAGSEATKGRTSLTCHLAKHIFPCPILLKKIHLLTNKPYGHMELPQVARYTDSQRYVEHYDGVDPHTDAGRAFCQNGGQRIATVLVYLDAVDSGGRTHSPRLNLPLTPATGPS